MLFALESGDLLLGIFDLFLQTRYLCLKTIPSVLNSVGISVHFGNIAIFWETWKRSSSGMRVVKPMNLSDPLQRRLQLLHQIQRSLHNTTLNPLVLSGQTYLSPSNCFPTCSILLQSCLTWSAPSSSTNIRGLANSHGCCL